MLKSSNRVSSVRPLGVTVVVIVVVVAVIVIEDSLRPCRACHPNRLNVTRVGSCYLLCICLFNAFT